MRLFNWRRQAVLNAMPLANLTRYVHRGMNSGDDFAVSYGDDRRIVRYFIDCGGYFCTWIAPYDAENYFDYDNLNNGLLCSTGLALIHWGVTFSAVSGWCTNLAGGGRVCRVYRCGDGTLLGLLAGYYEGWWDRLISAFAMCCLPSRVFYWRSLLLGVGKRHC